MSADIYTTDDPVKTARELCPELLKLLKENHPEYLIKYAIYCHDYLANPPKYSRTQQLLIANDVLLTYAWAKK